MSNTEKLPRVYFALVVDNEVASLYFVGASLEYMVAAFSSNPTFELNTSLSDVNQNVYDVFVNGEFAINAHIPVIAEAINAIFQSNPTIIRLTDEQLEMGVGPGWFWNGTEFTETP